MSVRKDSRTVDFIKAVRSEPILYNKSYGSQNKLKKKCVWEKIAFDFALKCKLIYFLHN